MTREIESRSRRLISNALYRKWFIADTASELGSSVQAFVLPLMALTLSGDPVQAGLVATAGVIASAVSDVIGGSLADMFSRFKLLFIGALAGLGICILWGTFEFFGSLTLFALMLLNILLASRFGLTSSASSAGLVEIVDDGEIGRALAANQGRDATISLVGAPLGGFLLSLGAWIIAPVIAACNVVSAVYSRMLLRSAPPGHKLEDKAPDEMEPQGFLKEAIAGFTWISSRADIRAAIAAAVLINLGISTALTTQIYYFQMSGTNATSVGLIPAASGAGMLLGTLVAGYFIQKVRGGAIAVWGSVVVALVVASLAVASNIWIVMVLLGVAMFIAPMYNSVLMGYLLLAVPSNLLGRVNSAAGLFSLVAVSAAPLIVGFGLSYASREFLAAFAALAIGLSLILIVCSSALRRLPVEARWKESAQQSS